MDKTDQVVMVLAADRHARVLYLAEAFDDLRDTHVILQKAHACARGHDLDDLGLTCPQQIVDQDPLCRIEHTFVFHLC